MRPRLMLISEALPVGGLTIGHSEALSRTSPRWRMRLAPTARSVRAMAEREPRMRFSVCIPDVDETVWRGVDEGATVADDADAAEHIARELVAHDPALLETFAPPGAVVLVRDRAFGKRCTIIQIAAEMIPCYLSRRIT